MLYFYSYGLISTLLTYISSCLFINAKSHRIKLIEWADYWRNRFDQISYLSGVDVFK